MMATFPMVVYLSEVLRKAIDAILKGAGEVSSIKGILKNTLQQETHSNPAPIQAGGQNSSDTI